MTYNSNFCNNFPQFTFQYPPPSFVTPPPPLPPFLVPPRPAPNPTLSDQEYVKLFDKPPVPSPSSQKSISISIAKEKLQNLVITLNNLKNQQKHLSEHNNTLSESQWSNALAEIEQNKQKINETMAVITSYLDTLTKLLAKRSAKRLRLNKLRVERKKEKEDQIEEMEERSRKIDENLQKIQNDIRRAKQEEASKVQADIVLKEVIRKKHDAKKYLVKLDALMKLRRAKQNTAKGRGENIVERDAEVFNNNIGKQITLEVVTLIKLCRSFGRQIPLRRMSKKL